MAGKFELKRSKDDKFYFNLKAGNGQVILSSQRYGARADAEGGIESVRTNAASPQRFERKTAANGDPYFVLKAANGQVIGKSEMYSSSSAMENGISSVQTNAPEAGLSDVTDVI